MPQVHYNLKSFAAKYGSLDDDYQVACSWYELVRAAFTVGRRDWNEVFKHDMHSLHEMVYRAAIIRANLHEIDGVWQQSPAFEGLDPSEKGGISYFLGLSTAKLLAEKILQVPWLMHLDVYKESLKPYVVSNVRPDLIGLDLKTNWIVVEAKGRSGGLDRASQKKAKQQATKLTKISDKVPYINIGMVTFFGKQGLQASLEDPPINNDGSSLNITDETFLFDYYSLFMSFLDSDYGRTQIVVADNGNSHYITKYINEIDVRVGMNENIYRLLKELQKERTVPFRLLLKFLPWFTQELAARQNASTTHTSPYVDRPDPTIGLDGILVQLGPSWETAQAAHLPVSPHPLPQNWLGSSFDSQHLDIAQAIGYLDSLAHNMNHNPVEFFKQLLITADKIGLQVSRRSRGFEFRLKILLDNYMLQCIPLYIVRLADDIDEFALGIDPMRYPRSTRDEFIQQQLTNIFAKYPLPQGHDLMPLAIKYINGNL